VRGRIRPLDGGEGEGIRSGSWGEGPTPIVEKLCRRCHSGLRGGSNATHPRQKNARATRWGRKKKSEDFDEAYEAVWREEGTILEGRIREHAPSTCRCEIGWKGKTSGQPIELKGGDWEGSGQRFNSFALTSTPAERDSVTIPRRKKGGRTRRCTREIEEVQHMQW